MPRAKTSDDRIGALALLLLSLYWVWVSAWPPVTTTAHDLFTTDTSGLSLLAGRNLTLGTATTTTQFDTGAAPGGNRLQATTSTQHGSTATAGGNATLVAQGGDLTVTASRVAAGGNATLAGQNVSIASGVNTTTRSSHLVNGSGYGDSTATTQRAAAASVQAGHNLTVQAAGNGQAGSGDLTVTGARLSAQNGQTTLQAAHDLSVVRVQRSPMLQHGPTTPSSAMTPMRVQGKHRRQVKIIHFINRKPMASNQSTRLEIM